MIELNTKIKKRIKKLADALSVSENCITQEVIPHDSVDIGGFNGDLRLIFSGGAGEDLSTEVRVFRNSQYIWGGNVLAPDTEVIIDGQNPPGQDEHILVVYRASCEGTDSGCGGWRTGYYVDYLEPQ